ncbi:MAG: hypothetical protein ACRCUJ_13635 [Phocaeicola sp.]
MKKPLNNRQAIILALLWAAMCFIILTGSEKLDGPLILSMLISGALVFIPIIKSYRQRKE